ncbi:O-methyltransferase [Runella sp.]|uniref:O-methyltransferase n=1 Tax=Runella sp. TaxID=1960881 RepID=UPI0030193296
MSASYNKIDYRLRIAKSVERRMMGSLFQNLNAFYPLEKYKYIGFGSVSFLDFSLFHRLLGINEMISIEREEHDKARFEFNNPYACIEIEWGESKDILPKIDISEKSIIWLDYDDKLTTDILSDIDMVFNRLNSGSFFCVSYNAQQDSEKDEKSRFEQISERIDNRYFPEYLYHNPNLNKTGIRKAYFDIIKNLIIESIKIRNENGDDISVKQLLFFSYNDGAEMNTIGWLFYNSQDKDKVDFILNKQFSFVKSENSPFEIKVPCLTYKEMRAIEEKFPNLKKCLQHYDKGKAKGGMLNQSDIEDYFNIYKNFSLFAEISL